MTVRRRQFLGASIAVAAAGVAAPGWLSRAFAQDRECAPYCDEVATLAAAFRRAQQAGKPLLVLVIPVDPAQRWVRGSAFGELINHADNATLARLALAEVVCAKMASVRLLVGQVSQGEPLMVLIETRSVPSRATAFDVQLPQTPISAMRGGGDSATEDELINRRLGMLSGLLDRALAPNGAALVQRAVQARGALGARVAADVDAILAGGGVPDPALADRAAALVAVAAATNEGLRQRRESRLAEAARNRLRARPIAGSRWASHSGCGTTIEGVPDNEQNMVDCGMGHVPRRSQRFLYLFSRSERQY